MHMSRARARARVIACDVWGRVHTDTRTHIITIVLLNVEKYTISFLSPLFIPCTMQKKKIINILINLCYLLAVCISYPYLCIMQGLAKIDSRDRQWKFPWKDVHKRSRDPNVGSRHLAVDGQLTVDSGEWIAIGDTAIADE